MIDHIDTSLRGRRFGSLVVEYAEHKRVALRCDCGCKVYASMDALTAGIVTSCVGCVDIRRMSGGRPS